MTHPLESSNDGKIVAAMLVGQEEAFAELVRRYQRALWRVARSRVGRDDWADDIVQETFLCVVKWLQTYDSRFSFRTWLWTILLNQCHRHLKKHSRGLLIGSWQEAEQVDGLREDLVRQFRSDQTPPEHLIAKERSQLLDALLLRLPESQADALRLRFFGTLTFPEIAAAMDCSLSTAKNRVKWGLLKLAEHLGPDGEFAGLRPADLETTDEHPHKL
jgi:RNA polymerase sigma-70 factor, ECF subfamily